MLKIIKKIIAYLFIFVVFSFFVWMGYLFLEGRDPVILMYHSVGERMEKENILNISEDVFEKQMSLLREGGYHVISLIELADMLKRKERIPFKTVVITFDDGYENNYTKAYPILEKYHFPATIFMIVDYVGQEKAMMGRRWRFLSKEMLKELSAGGLVTIGAHTKSHRYLPDVKSVSELDSEITGSKKELEDILQKPVDAFAYPVGGYNADVLRCVSRAGLRVAVTTLPLKKFFRHPDIYALKRVKMTKKAISPFVFFIETSGYYIKMKEMNG